MSNPGVLTVDGASARNAPQAAFYFDLEPVLERSRALSSHPERAQLMCEHCVKRLAPTDIMLPQPGGFFLILISAEGAAAETLAHEINIALLELFFGSDALNQNLGTICRRATLDEIRERGIDLPPPKAKKAPETDKAETDPLARLAKNGLPGYDGLSTGFVPVTNLSRESNALYLCGPVRRMNGKTLFGAAAMTGINAQDRASLDEAMLEYSLGFAQAPTGHSPTAVIAPVHYETLAWSRGRQLYQKALRAAEVAANPFLMVKIEGIPSGTPAARLTEIISMVRPFVRRMFVELPEWDPNLMRGGHLGVSGFMNTLQDGISLPVAGRTMQNFVQFATVQQAFACIANISGPNQLALARTAGVRFAVRSLAETGIHAAPHEELASRAA